MFWGNGETGGEAKYLRASVAVTSPEQSHVTLKYGGRIAGPADGDASVVGRDGLVDAAQRVERRCLRESEGI